MVTTALPFQCGKGDTFKSRRVQFFETYNVMNWKKLVLISYVLACTFAASTATAQMRGGHRASMARMPMRGAPMRGSMARMPMQRGPMLNSAFGFHRFNDGDFDRDDRFRRFNRFNDFDRDDRFRRFHHHNNFNDIIIFDNFGFPLFPPFFPFLPPRPFPPF
jgi:hypothetical protein